MSDDEVTELHGKLMLRAEACDSDALRYADSEGSAPTARREGKADAYRHAAELLRAAAKGGAA